MALSDLGERFAKTPMRHKYLGLVGVLVLFGAVFYFMFYSDLSDKVAKLERTRKTLEAERSSYEGKKQKYMAFRADVKKLLREKKELLKVLPTTAEIPSFLQSLHAQAELAGLNILMFSKAKEIRRGFYAEIPVHLSIVGTYHQIMKFFYSVGNLKRIVTARDLLLAKRSKSAKNQDKGVMLSAKFVASTFRFVEQKSQPRRRR